MKTKLLDGAPEEIVMEREFAAPRALVYRAMTEAELVKRWQGNSRSPLVECEIDARVGGAYRYLYRATNGYEFTFTGVFTVVSEERTVLTQKYSGAPGECLVTTTLTARGDHTIARITMRFDSKATRDQVIATGMADGANESYDNLETLLRTL
ncbi:MAG: SRPBCC family protein [Kofleriaceae bacterium]